MSLANNTSCNGDGILRRSSFCIFVEDKNVTSDFYPGQDEVYGANADMVFEAMETLRQINKKEGEEKRRKKMLSSCTNCNGSGDIHKYDDCPVCYGSGELENIEGNITICKACKGYGIINERIIDCPTCNGSGINYNS